MSNSNIDNEVVQNMSKEQRKQLNADPISGEPGAHPIGTGVGAAGGAASGAAIGAVGGPVGVAVGGVVGAVVGGLAGKSISEAVNPTDEDVYWRETYNTRPYYKETITLYDDVDYDRDYRDAYHLGYTSRSNYPYETKFEEVEADLKLQWEKTKRESRLKWEEAKHAVKDAWDRVMR